MHSLVLLGSQGFIFSHVAEYFLDKGYQVYGFDNLSEGSHPDLLDVWKNKYPNWHFHQMDVSDPSVIDVIVSINPVYMIQAAAISDVDYSIKFPTKTIEANNMATINAFEAARKCSNLKKLLYVSTDEVYGECDHPKREDEILFPRNPYALSKAFGSLMRLSYDNTYSELYGKTCETRFCNVFGPRQDDRKVIPAIIRAAHGGDPLIVHNEGKGYRQWIYVKDIPRVVHLMLQAGDRTYNITSGVGMSVVDLILLAESILGRIIPTVQGDRSGMDMMYQMSGDRMFDQFGWSPEYVVRNVFRELLTGKET